MLQDMVQPFQVVSGLVTVRNDRAGVFKVMHFLDVSAVRLVIRFPPQRGRV
jgi:hypothetical protein